jgi:hypothetical protein
LATGRGYPTGSLWDISHFEGIYGLKDG